MAKKRNDDAAHAGLDAPIDDLTEAGLEPSGPLVLVEPLPEPASSPDREDVGAMTSAGPVVGGLAHTDGAADALATALAEAEALRNEIAAMGDPVERMRATAAKYGEAVEAKRKAVAHHDALIRDAFSARVATDERCNRVELPALNALQERLRRLDGRIKRLRAGAG